MTQWTFDQNSEFNTKVADVMRRQVRGFNDLSQDEQDDTRISYIDNFHLENNLPEGCAPQAAVALFAHWLDLVWVRASANHMETVGLSMQVDYGSVKMTYTSSAVVKIMTPIERTNALEVAVKSVTQLRQEYESGYLPSLIAPPAYDQKNTEPAKETEEWDASFLKVVVEDGKRSFRVVGGRWTKFGVAIYEEVLRASNIDPTTISLEGMLLGGRVATCELSGGKPRRILALTRPPL